MSENLGKVIINIRDSALKPMQTQHANSTKKAPFFLAWFGFEPLLEPLANYRYDKSNKPFAVSEYVHPQTIKISNHKTYSRKNPLKSYSWWVRSTCGVTITDWVTAHVPFYGHFHQKRLTVTIECVAAMTSLSALQNALKHNDNALEHKLGSTPSFKALLWFGSVNSSNWIELVGRERKRRSTSLLAECLAFTKKPHSDAGHTAV